MADTLNARLRNLEQRAYCGIYVEAEWRNLIGDYELAGRIFAADNARRKARYYARTIGAGPLPKGRPAANGVVRN